MLASLATGRRTPAEAGAWRVAAVDLRSFAGHFRPVAKLSDAFRVINETALREFAQTLKKNL